MEKEISLRYKLFANSDELNAIEKKLLNAAKNTRKNAYAPYSNFLVGCAILLDNGQIVVGNNQENSAYPSGLCAERTAIFWASANFPDQKIKKICIVGGSAKNPEKNIAISPCGACRQSILEFEIHQKNSIEIYIASLEGHIYKINSTKDLLPFSFDSSFL